MAKHAVEDGMALSVCRGLEWQGVLVQGVK